MSAGSRRGFAIVGQCLRPGVLDAHLLQRLSESCRRRNVAALDNAQGWEFGQDVLGLRQISLETHARTALVGPKSANWLSPTSSPIQQTLPYHWSSKPNHSHRRYSDDLAAFNVKPQSDLDCQSGSPELRSEEHVVDKTRSILSARLALVVTKLACAASIRSCGCDQDRFRAMPYQSSCVVAVGIVATA